MKRLLIKIIMLAALPLIPFMSVSNAQFHDKETLAQHTFSARSLDFELRNTQNQPQTEPLFDVKKMKLGKESKASVKVTNIGSETFSYYPSFEYTGGMIHVCDALTITADVDGTEVYSGPLNDFNLASKSAALSGSSDLWKFTLINTDDDPTLQGKQCEFALVFTSTGQSFSDTESVTNTVSIAYEPKLTAVYNPSKHTFSFTLNNLQHFLGFTYTLIYDTDSAPQETTNTVILNNENAKTEKIYLGTCSSDVCTPYDNPHNFTLTIGVVDIDNEEIIITEER